MKDRREELADELEDVMQKAVAEAKDEHYSFPAIVTGTVFGWITGKIAALEDQVTALEKQRKGKAK
jgi:hypothetical protein